MAEKSRYLSNSERTALITGGITGIGRAITSRLARDGFSLAINYKGSEKNSFIRSLRKELEFHNVKYVLIKADISKILEVERMIKIVEKNFGKVDALINNAGINQNQNFSNLDFSNFDKILDVNLRGAVMITKYTLPLFEKALLPRIIFISSVNAFVGSAARVAYTVSKSGLLGLTKALALELAPKVLVNSIVPGYIDTDMFRRFKSENPYTKIKRIPLKRIGLPEDVAGAASFLCSPDSSYITGQCIHVNGGLFLS